MCSSKIPRHQSNALTCKECEYYDPKVEIAAQRATAVLAAIIGDSLILAISNNSMAWDAPQAAKHGRSEHDAIVSSDIVLNVFECKNP